MHNQQVIKRTVHTVFIEIECPPDLQPGDDLDVIFTTSDGHQTSSKKLNYGDLRRLGFVPL